MRRKRFSHLTKRQKKLMNERALQGQAHAEKYGCLTCHSGPMFDGAGLQPFPLIPGSVYDKRYKLTEHLGKFEETGKYTDRHLWQVKTLRNVANTSPYFHNESVKTLDEAVRVMAMTQLGRVLKESEVEEIVEFLRSL